MSWPAVRTVAVTPKEIGGDAMALACFGAFLGAPMVIFVVTTGVTGFLGLPTINSSGQPTYAGFCQVIAMVLPIISLPFLAVGAALAFVAGWTGHAGWLVATAAGGLLATLVWGGWGWASDAPWAALIDPRVTLAGALQGLSFWLGVKRAKPGALRSRPR